jgi:hypothetical protein
MPPKRPNPRPPAPIRIMSRRETPQSPNRLLVAIVVRLSAVGAGTSTRFWPTDSKPAARDDLVPQGSPRIPPLAAALNGHSAGSLALLEIYS